MGLKETKPCPPCSAVLTSLPRLDLALPAVTSLEPAHPLARMASHTSGGASSPAVASTTAHEAITAEASHLVRGWPVAGGLQGAGDGACSVVLV